MKRAPLIPKTTHTVPIPSSATGPAAPMVDSLIARVGAMAKGNSITLPICGRDVKFTLETIPGVDVAQKSRVWGGNERDQELLNEESLDDLIPSFLLTGQQNPAFGRSMDGIIEVADGSRRRMTSILTSSEYRILVGDLDDAQMDSLCKLGNDYRPTSAYERGKRYQRRLNSEFNNNISALADDENISRKIITRCLHTAKLPREIITLFSHPGELSARAGEQLYRNFEGHEKEILDHTKVMVDRKKSGVMFETEEILEEFANIIKKKNSKAIDFPTKREFLPGAMAQYKGNKIVLTLDRTKLPDDCISKIESVLDSYNSNK